MTTLRAAGLFSDVPFGDPGAPKLAQSLHVAVIAADAPRIAEYLRSGLIFAIVPAVVHDILSDDRSMIGPLRYLTDGAWLWRSDLAYYVDRYQCHVDDEFLYHIKDRDWQIPCDIELDQLKAPPEWSGEPLKW